MSTAPYTITIIGAGNVAYHLGLRLFEKGFNIQQIFSRKITKARKLAKKVNARATRQLSTIESDVDIVILAVHDDAIVEVAKQLQPRIGKALVVHTSGGMESTILKPFFKNYGCFYPLQTFSIDKAVDFEQLPICIYSPQKRNRQKLEKLGRKICPNIYLIDDFQKSVLHVAAVFVNNFTNHLYHIGQQISEEAKIDFSILLPLILATSEKIKTASPVAMQTGPARRGDQQTIEKHLRYLEKHPQWAQLYRLLSAGIAQQF